MFINQLSCKCTLWWREHRRTPMLFFRVLCRQTFPWRSWACKTDSKITQITHKNLIMKSVIWRWHCVVSWLLAQDLKPCLLHWVTGIMSWLQTSDLKTKWSDVDICFFFPVQKPTKVISLPDSVLSGMRATDKLHNCIYASFMASSLILPLTFCSRPSLFMAIGFRLWKGNSKPVEFFCCFFVFAFQIGWRWANSRAGIVRHPSQWHRSRFVGESWYF